MKIHRSVTAPIERLNASWEQKWNGPDQGLITAWELGRNEGQQDEALAVQARTGQLVVLPFKGGVAKELKLKKKYGTFYYLAMWQGLRGEDLQIDTDVEMEMTCPVTKMIMVFTSDVEKYGEP